MRSLETRANRSRSAEGLRKSFFNQEESVFSRRSMHAPPSVEEVRNSCFTPAAEGHGLCPWMNAPAFGRDVAPLGREEGATGYARGAPQRGIRRTMSYKTVSRFRHLYGPVPSRRLGRSLGIDLVPHKVCTYDCIYCQIGKTTKGTWKRDEYVPKEEIMEEVKAFLSEDPPPIDYFSLSGSGEPTLHSGIRWIIEEIKKLSAVPVAVITNGSLLCDEEVRRDLL